MKFRSIGVAAVALLLPFAAVACGGGKDDNDSGSRLSVAEIKTEINEVLGAEAEVPEVEEVVDCLAQEFHDSDLPNGVLRKVIAGEEAEVDKDNKDKYEKITEEIQIKCAGTAVE